MKRFALAGNPNSGKTTLFNSLTGSSEYVGNWPGVTVEKKTGTYKNKKNGTMVSVVDLPGIYSLSPYTPEEVVSRNYILDEKPDCVINIVDATNLERNLYLTTQILEMDVPVVIALNMMDAVRKNGDSIDTAKLANALGVPVIGISALKEENLDDLMVMATRTSETQRRGRSFLKDCLVQELIDSLSKAYGAKGILNARFHATKLVEDDEIEKKAEPDLSIQVSVYKETFKNATFGTDFEAIVADARYRYISEDLAIAETKRIRKASEKMTLSDKIDRLMTNKWVALPLFAIVLFLIFHFVFGEDLFYLNAMGVVDSTFPGDGPFAGLFSNGGIASLGVFLQSLLTDCTDWLSNLTRTGMSNAGAAAWSIGLVCDGVMGGLFAVLSFLPQIALLFFFFSILEDSGYMARIAFILDKIFRKYGLSGRAFLPMIMGFGCSVPAMMNTRTLATDNERTSTIRVIPFFSCGAKLPIILAVAGCVAELFGFAHPELITLGMYFLGVIVALVCVLLMRHTTLKGATPPFIMELPSYHLPQPRALAIHVWDKTKHFVKKAFTIILASTILIWFLTHFAWNWNYLADEDMGQSILASLGKIIQPIFTPLGFGSQLTGGQNGSGWTFGVAAISGLIAKENVIGTFGTLAASLGHVFDPDLNENAAGIAYVLAIAKDTGIGVPGLLSFIAFNVFAIPCFAATATARAELPNGRFKGTIAFWLGTAYLVSSAIYTIGTWWWTSFIWAGAFLLALYLIHWYNGKHPVNKGEVA
ncbi:MAG: Ferrous iron transport protein B [Tenericutes bacterium ADurb.BinA155]|nr:MAG: Ferrous iron transport protein B [Tenericutes bacterium ADurb.BinA155]